MMLSYARNVFILVSLVTSIAAAQPLQPGEWRSYTSLRTVQDIAINRDSTQVWVATRGGAFQIDLRNGNALKAYRTTDGLTENDVTAVATDAAGNVFFGERNGGFDILPASTGKLQQRLEIRDQPGITVKTINRIRTSGDRVYLATAFGLSVYSTAGQGYFITTVNRIGELPQGDSVIDVAITNGRIYLAMNEGVASAPVTAELTIPSVWRLAHLETHPTALAVFRGQVIAATDSGFYKFLNEDSLVQISALGGDRLLAAVANADSLFALASSGTLIVTHDLQSGRRENVASELNATPTTLSALRGFAIIGTIQNGVYFATQRGFDAPLYPQGPIFNDVSDIVYSISHDQIYTSHGSFGLSAFTPTTGTWIDYPAGADIPATGYVKIVDDPVRDVVWASGFGLGLIKLQHMGTPQVHYDLYTAANGLPPQDGPTFVVPGDGIIDRDGRFVVALWAANGRGIAATSDGQTFTTYPLAPASNLGISWGCIAQDHEGNYWVGTQHSEPLSRGVFWSRASDRAFGYVPSGPGAKIANTNVNAILTDQDDGIWCGTESGVQIISNPYAISQANPSFYVRSVKLLEQQLVHAMTTDGVGNKWIATDRGIFVVSPDGTDSVAHFSMANSPLIDDNVTAIAIDQTRGEVYAGTPSGISRFSTIFTSGKSDYTGIRVYPNPLVQTSESSPEVTIEGLVSGSTVKIFTLNGKLVATVNGSSLGSTVKWDGRDSMGHVVTSGLYLITATSPGSGDNGEAKLVIVRDKP
jgi:hypothetical protein